LDSLAFPYSVKFRVRTSIQRSLFEGSGMGPSADIAGRAILKTSVARTAAEARRIRPSA